MVRHRVKPQDILLALSVPLIWGLGFTLAKAGMSQFPPILLTALRFSLTALVLVWFVRPPRGMMVRIFWVALVGGTIQYSLTFTGLHGMDASTAIIIVQLEVPFALILSVIFLKDRLGGRRAIGVALAFGGVVLVAGEPRFEVDYLPMLLVVAGTFSWAVGQILVKTVRQVSGFTLIAWVAVFSAPQLFVASFLFEDGQVEAVANADWTGWAVIIYLGLIMTAVGYAAWYHVLGKYPVTQVMPYLMLLPVTVLIGGVLILGETVTTVTLIGAAIVIAGVAFITLGRAGDQS
jgi:O-acetylserine/cysteine efflux transporter